MKIVYESITELPEAAREILTKNAYAIDNCDLEATVKELEALGLTVDTCYGEIDEISKKVTA